MKIQTQVYMTAYMTIEDDVFVGPGVTTTNDDTMSRHDKSYVLRGPEPAARLPRRRRRDALPGRRDRRGGLHRRGRDRHARRPARGVAMGVPARVVREVADEDLLERWRS